ncbi:MAG: phosphotransferase, partial [Bacteroidales bacterium]
IRFLEEEEEVHEFLRSVFKLADSSVDRYIERGFTHLQFAFGCTGGQHRSVYCAERLSKHIYDRFKVRTRLIHREQGIEVMYGG